MRFWRAHGLGNDYLVLESGEPLDPALVRAVCDRHTGVGSDGILEPVPGEPWAVRIHNPDGSEAEKSGNGLRIFARWLVDRRGAPPVFHVDTAGGRVCCHVGADVRVEMGPARIVGVETLAGLPVTRVNVGNPHAVHLGIPEDWAARGAVVEHSVPGRTNVQFVEVRDGVAHARIWERGAGHTRSSGSSACAVAAVVVARGLLASPVLVRMEGGDLRVVVGEQVEIEGPVQPIALIEVDPGWLACASPR